MFTHEELAHAQSCIDRINKAAGYQRLQLVVPPRTLSDAALHDAFAAIGSGWVTTSTLFSLTYQQKPTHGEAILAGKWLAARGLQRKKSGPTTLWLLDESVLQGAD